MKIKVVFVILAVACLGLVVALFATKKQADDQRATDITSINDFSNQVVEANEHLKEIGQVNLTLSNDLASSQQQLEVSAEQLTQLSNSLTAASATLAETKASLAETRTSLAATQELVTNLNNRITDLEAQNKVLDQQAESLSNTLSHLTAQIEDTKNQLAIAETNSAFLQGELQKQLAQKAELEHKFNDVDELRFQVKKLKDEMFVARRLQLMKSDLGLKKGGELLMMHGAPLSAPPPRKLAGTNYDLNVEIGSDGSVKVIPPLAGTNNPTR
jgi:chromosome segregation ATPase